MGAAKKNVIEIEPFLDFDEVAEKTGTTISFLKKAKRQYGLPHYKIGRNVKFRLSEIELWFSQRRIVG